MKKSTNRTFSDGKRYIEVSYFLNDSPFYFGQGQIFEHLLRKHKINASVSTGYDCRIETFMLPESDWVNDFINAINRDYHSSY